MPPAFFQRKDALTDRHAKRVISWQRRAARLCYGVVFISLICSCCAEGTKAAFLKVFLNAGAGRGGQQGRSVHD
jgi:hypothetical protein